MVNKFRLIQSICNETIETTSVSEVERTEEELVVFNEGVAKGRKDMAQEILSQVYSELPDGQLGQ